MNPHALRQRSGVTGRPAIAWRALAGLLLMLSLAACTATGGTPATQDPTSAAPAGSTTLVLWHGWSSAARQPLSRLVAQFNQQHPAGRIVLQAIPLASFDSDLRAALAAGSGPHILLIPNAWVGTMAERNTLLPLDDLLPAADRAALLPAARGGAQARGPDGATHLYGLPISFDTQALFYDKRNLLRPPDDTDTLIRNARGLSDPAAPRWGLAINLSLDNTIGYLYAAGGRVFDEQGAVVLGAAGRAGAERWLAWLKQLNDDQQLLARADSSIQIDRELKGGRVLASFDWAHQLSFYRSLWGADLGIAPLPRLAATNQPPQPYVRSDVLAINSRAAAAERRAALDFLAFMGSPAAQAELLKSDLQPARGDLKLGEIGLDAAQLRAAEVFRGQAQQAQPQPNAPARTREIVRRELTLMLRQVLHGDATAADMVSEADQHLREQLPR